MIRFLFLSLSIFFCPLLIAKEAIYIKLADKASSCWLRKLHEKKNIFLRGFGGGMMFDVEKINFSLHSYGTFSVDEARHHYLEIAEDFLKIINEDKALRPYLHYYPYTINGLGLDISFSDLQTGEVTKGSIALVFYSEKTSELFYSVKDEEKGRIIPFYRETYEEAKKKWKHSNDFK